ncbi:MAG: TIGR02099 family protein [Hydrogenophaga sp.]|nr:TIGR02099 family protein [Hydrogenophaga sp.]
MNQRTVPAAPKTPARAHKTYLVITRMLLWAVLLVWVLFALTLGALHLWIVPRIDDWRPDLERWASAAVGIPVKVGAIRAESVGDAKSQGGFVVRLVPAIELQDVRLYDPAGREALHLPSVHAAISVPSLWRLGFEQLLIEGPVLDIRRTPEGRIEIAGLDFSGPQNDEGRAADWFFSQTEFVIRNGTVRWTDELRGQPTLALDTLSLVARNGLRSHLLRLDATPPAEWGQRFSLMASLREPLIDLGAVPAGKAQWHNWSGEVYADFPAVDVSRLKAYVDLSQWNVEVRAGRGRLRAWGDVAKGGLTGVTADLALRDVATRLGADLPELGLERVEGRLAASWNAQGFDLSTYQLGFRTDDGLDWPAASAHLRHERGGGRQLRTTSLEADRIELAALAALATRVPLPQASRGLLASLRPSGRVEGFSARWQGPAAPAEQAAAEPPPITAYQAKGRALGLSLSGQPSEEMSRFGPYPVPGRPGLTGAQVDFDLNQGGGSARIDIASGSLDLPGVFEESVIPLTSLQADARWRLEGERIEAWLENVRMANAHAAGTARAHWTTADPATSKARSRFPGILDLDATLTRADARQVYRYMPQSVGPDVRRYVQTAVRAGSSDKVVFRVRGDVWDMPFHEPGADGEFRISAPLSGLDFDYLPAYLQSVGEPAWPALKGMSGQLLLDKASLRLSALNGSIDGQTQLLLSEGVVAIPDMMNKARLEASSRVAGPAGDLVGFVQQSPLDGLLSGALTRATANGAATTQFKLMLPLEKVEDFTLQGAVQLTGNDVRITPDAPLLERASGTVGFTEKGFRLQGAKARMYGGEVVFEGGLQGTGPDGSPRIEFRGQGTASAEGLRDGGLGIVSKLFANAGGSATYSARLGFRGGAPEISVNSNLQGMALNLPAPLQKRADEVLPLRYETAVTAVGPTRHGDDAAQRDRLLVDVGPASQPLFSLAYERDLADAQPRVLRGRLGVGLQAGEEAPMPVDGVVANLRFNRFDADAWQKVFRDVSGVEVHAVGNSPSPEDAAVLSYLPTVLAVRAEEVLADGRTFHNLVLGGTREGPQWRANVDARELNGYVEYRQSNGGGAGSIYARLAQLNLPPSAAADVEQLLEQPSSVPALDVAVENLVLSGRELGLVTIQAVNRGTGGNREWKLNKLNVRVPEARLIGSGNWTSTEGSPRRTRLDFRLDVDDAGKLLARFGRAGLVRGGKGVIEGALSWTGSPLALDYPSLSGEMSTNFEAGQFLKVEPGAAKLLGVLSLQALPRRLTLDFRDVFTEGFTFDFLRGDVQVKTGVAFTNNLQMKGINAAVLMEGSADIAREQQDLQVVVVPELNAGTASLIATAINPAIGLGSFLAQFILRQPLQSATTQQFHISGSWADPKVEKIAQPKPPDATAPRAPAATPAPAVK